MHRSVRTAPRPCRVHHCDREQELQQGNGGKSLLRQLWWKQFQSGLTAWIRAKGARSSSASQTNVTAQICLTRHQQCSVLGDPGKLCRQEDADWWMQYYNIRIIGGWAERRCLHPLQKYSFPVTGKNQAGCHGRKERKPLPTKEVNLPHASLLRALCQATASHAARKMQGSEVAAGDYSKLRSGRKYFSFNYELPAISPPPLKFKALHFVFT